MSAVNVNYAGVLGLTVAVVDPLSVEKQRAPA